MEKDKEIIEARSKENGIVFYSNTLPLVGSETFFDEHGNIHTRIIFTKVDEMVDYLGTLNKEQPFFNKKFVILFDMILLILCIIITFLQVILVLFWVHCIFLHSHLSTYHVLPNRFIT